MNIISIADRMVPLAQYQEARSHIFPSGASLAWFIHRYRPRLVEMGALVKPAGHTLAVVDRLDEAAAVIGAERANRRPGA